MRIPKTEILVVNVPSDCTTDRAVRHRLAFLAAEEAATVYALPCEWQIVEDDGENVTVHHTYFVEEDAGTAKAYWRKQE